MVGVWPHQGILYIEQEEGVQHVAVCGFATNGGRHGFPSSIQPSHDSLPHSSSVAASGVHDGPRVGAELLPLYGGASAADHFGVGYPYRKPRHHGEFGGVIPFFVHHRVFAKPLAVCVRWSYSTCRIVCSVCTSDLSGVGS